MAMSHGVHAGAEGDRRALVISGWLTGGYFVVELVVGLWSGSVAVLSDAFHTFSAVGGVLIALAAVVDAAEKDRVLQEATEALRTGFDVYFSTLQVEQECLDEQAAGDIDITRRPHPGR